MISRHAYVVTLSAEGIKLALKGKRKGYEFDWESLISGDAALAAALNATLAKGPATPRETAFAKKIEESAAVVC